MAGSEARLLRGVVVIEILAAEEPAPGAAVAFGSRHVTPVIFPSTRVKPAAPKPASFYTSSFCGQNNCSWYSEVWRLSNQESAARKLVEALGKRTGLVSLTCSS